jgi:hypothetical protein
MYFLLWELSGDIQVMDYLCPSFIITSPAGVSLRFRRVAFLICFTTSFDFAISSSFPVPFLLTGNSYASKPFNSNRISSLS